ncbi:phage tail protein [Rodentibacter pneumotropicus]|uniref:phage tail protein n=1 Tax=Rodentibacter pneumotropicus TaxID=758 RepID=UPI00109C0176|nr:phage tail protein [Rodentibacter pneumotropicus]THA07305.1 phage tail protein [Rodentibacter pneumotropicus]
MKTFTFPPQWNMKRKAKPEINVLKFGDGYEQRRANGINNDLRTYDVVFKGINGYINQIDSFLTEHNGYKAFLWTPPHSGKQSKFRCEEWDVDISEGFSVLTATFQEVVA